MLHSSGVSHEDDFRCFRKLARTTPKACLVDIGANTGQSAISFLANCPNGKVMSFEPNKLYEPVLEAVQSILGKNRFSYFFFGLSDSDSSMDLYIPCVDGTPYMQESSITLDQFEKPWVKERLNQYGQRLEIASISCDFKVGDEVIADPALIDIIDIIKIDAEGAEMKVLLGLTKVIEKYKPALLIENNDYHSVTPFLKKLGYEDFKYNSTTDILEPMSGATTNCFYLIQDKHLELLEA